MSILSFNHLLQFHSIWKSIPFQTKVERELANSFLKKIIDSEVETNKFEIEKKQKQCFKVMKQFSMISSMAEEISHSYSIFMEKRKAAWLYLSLSLYNKQYDQIIEPESNRILKAFEPFHSQKRIILAPFHMGMHTMTMPLITRYCHKSTILVNSGEIDIIRKWMSTYLEPKYNASTVMVPVPSHTGPLKFAKAIMRGETGIIFPEFSYGINQDEEEIDFLGGTFKVPIGVYVLAKRLSAIVYPIGSVWNQETNTVQFMIGDPLDAGTMLQFDFLQHLFSQGEKWIAEHPEQWFWDYLIES